MTKTQQEINDEKRGKDRPDLVPPRAIAAGGRAFAVGVAKHGLADNGRGTYRVHGTEQADPNTHWASLMRHLNAYRRGELVDPDSGLSHLDHAVAQLAIVVDLTEDPPQALPTSGAAARLIAAVLHTDEPSERFRRDLRDKIDAAIETSPFRDVAQASVDNPPKCEENTLPIRAHKWVHEGVLIKATGGWSFAVSRQNAAMFADNIRERTFGRITRSGLAYKQIFCTPHEDGTLVYTGNSLRPRVRLSLTRPQALAFADELEKAAAA